LLRHFWVNPRARWYGKYFPWYCAGCAHTHYGDAHAIWPEGKRQNTWVALLAAVFPGFTQQWIVVAFSSYFAGMILFFLSITVMIKAIRDPRKFWLFFSLSSSCQLMKSLGRIFLWS